MNPAAGGRRVTLAVVTYNQAGLLREFIGNWSRYGSDRVDLLVIDDGSSDGTPEAVRALAGRADAAAYRIPHHSIARARNEALRRCGTPWIAFSDTDCRLDRAYFEALAGLPDRYTGVTAVEGAVRPAPGPKPPFTHSLFNARGGTFATANMAFLARAALDAGGFDEGFGNYREDADLALTLLERHGEIPFYAELIVEHPHLPRAFGKAFLGAWATQERVLRSEMRLYAKHPSTYRRVRHYDDARRTVRAWRRKYFALYFKECFRYLFKEPGVTAADRLRALPSAVQAMVVALAEQACIVGLCMVKWGEIAKLESP